MLRYTLWRLAGLALVPVALTFAGAAPALAGGGPAGEPTLTITASDTPDWFDVQLANLHRDEQVSYTLTGPDQQLFGGNAHTSNGNGDLTFGFKMPRAAEAGQWTITFEADKSGEVVGSFTAAAQDPNIAVEASQDQAEPNAVLSITSGRSVFDDREPISYWLADPAGAVVQSGVVDATKKGELDLSLPVGVAAPGAYTIKVYGWHDDVYGVAPITIS